MKVRMKQSLQGPGVRLRPGEEYECSALEGERLILIGIADPIKQRRKRAVKAEPEQAVKS